MSEEAIKRKLAADGEGHGDDRRFGLLAKTFFQWAMEPDKQSELALASERRMNAHLSLCDVCIRKTTLVHDRQVRELEIYQNFNSKIDYEIEQALRRIEECKKELTEAKIIRRQRQEYSVLAGIIKQHPGRKDTLMKLDKVRSEIAMSEEKKKALEEKLEKRKKEFSVLMLSLLELKDLLKEDEDDRKPLDEPAEEDSDIQVMDVA